MQPTPNGASLFAPLEITTHNEVKMEFNYGAKLEIHFHQQNEVSIFLENTTSGEDEIKSDLFLLFLKILKNNLIKSLIPISLMMYYLYHIKDLKAERDSYLIWLCLTKE